jgi:hypothetical protein
MARRAAGLSRRASLRMLGVVGLTALLPLAATVGATGGEDASRCQRQVKPCKARSNGKGLRACCEKLATCKFEAFLACSFNAAVPAKASSGRRGSGERR